MVDARRALAAAALTCALVVTGCTTDKPAAPIPSPSPASPTPTETALERQERLDYAAAEKSYRTFRAEFDRVMHEGGAHRPTAMMKKTAGGGYLSEFAEIIDAYRGLGLHTIGIETIVYVHPAGHSENEVELQVCEDSRRIKDIDRAGKTTSAGEIRTVSLQVKRTPEGWQVWSGQGKKVSRKT